MKKLTGRIANLGKYAHAPKGTRGAGMAKLVKTTVKTSKPKKGGY
jgi:hypothetical protein